MFKILQARLQQYVNRELSDVQARFRKHRGKKDQIANIHWIIEKTREFQQKEQSTSALLNTLKPLTVWITTKGKILKRDVKTIPPILPSERPVCRSKSNN